jgi:Terpene cyclase DEP1
MRTILLIVTVCFAAFTLVVVAHTGFIGFYQQLLATWVGWQVFADVVISLSLVLAWMWTDARRHGRNWWPWAALTLALGSIGPLLYLLSRRRAPRSLAAA